MWKAAVFGGEFPPDDTDVLGYWPECNDYMAQPGLIWPVHYYGGCWYDCDTREITARPKYWMPIPSKPDAFFFKTGGVMTEQELHEQANKIAGKVGVSPEVAKAIVLSSEIRLAEEGHPWRDELAWTVAQIFYEGEWKTISMTTLIDDVGVWLNFHGKGVDEVRKSLVDNRLRYGARISKRRFQCIAGVSDG